MRTPLVFLLITFVSITYITGLKFGHAPITLNTEVFIVGNPGHLTCNFIKYRSESVRSISWYAAYAGVRSMIFDNMLATGKKKYFDYSFIKVQKEDGGQDDKLVVILPEFRNAKMTIGCEVEVLRDNGYGKIRHSKKLGEADFTVINIADHRSSDPDSRRMVLKSNVNSVQAGSPLKLTCLIRGTEPAPSLRIQVGKEQKILNFTEEIENLREMEYGITVMIDSVLDRWFDESGLMPVACLARFVDYVYDKKVISIQRKTSTDRSGSEYDLYSSRQRMSPNVRRGNKGFHDNEQGFDADVVSNRMLDMMDPARHANSGTLPDFFNGYILVQEKHFNVKDVPSTYTSVIGELPAELQTKFNRMHGKVKQLGEGIIALNVAPIEVLNILGDYGYRVVSSAASPNQETGMHWTMERKVFNMAKKRFF